MIIIVASKSKVSSFISVVLVGLYNRFVAIKKNSPGRVHVQKVNLCTLESGRKASSGSQ